MRQLYIKQKILSLGGSFQVLDDSQTPVYSVEGSFFSIPKEFVITDMSGVEIGKITKKLFSFMPRFYVEVCGQEVGFIQKEFTFFRSRYTIDSDEIDVQGDWWDMSFDLTRHGQTIASVHKKWLSWGDTYEVTVFEEKYEQMIISFVIAMDYVKASDNSSNSNPT